MKPGNNNRRPRGRGPRKPHGHGMGGSGKGQGYDGGGGEFRVRGNAHQILERYLQLARDAGVAGDRVAAENYLQHADHYYRVLTAIHDGQRPRIGGREVSVAEVNVQNVSQSLSASLSTSSGQMNAAAGQISTESVEQGAMAPTESGQNLAPDGSQNFNRAPDHLQARGHGGDDGLGPRPTYVRAQGQQEPIPIVEPGPLSPTAPVARQTSRVAADEQPDYPEELLPVAAAPQPVAPEQPAQAEDDANRPMRSRLRGRMRGPARRSRGPGDEGSETDGAES